MTTRGWKALDNDAEVAWLAEHDPDGYTTGFDVDGWAASTWVLNSIYRFDVVGPVPTHDEVRREELRLGIAEPHLIGDVDMDQLTTTPGVELGFARRPTDPRWRRLRWLDLADELDVNFDHEKYPPSSGWFRYKSWPANIEPPVRSSLDEATVDALVPHLVRHAGTDECIASYAVVAYGLGKGADFERCFSGSLDRIVDLAEGCRSTPSNVWPPDRSWFVYTDADLSGTRVSGTPELIADLREDPYLETIEWSAPDLS